MLSLRTRLWHDPLVQTWHSLARMVGLSCGSEVYNLMVNSGKRPDVAIFKDLYNIITDVRTPICVPPLSNSMLVVANNEDEIRGSRGRWATRERATMMKRSMKRHGGPGSQPWKPPLGRPPTIF